MSSTAFFSIIYEPYYTISANFYIVGANWSHMFKLHGKRLGPISSLVCTDCIRKGRAQIQSEDKRVSEDDQ